MQRNIGRMVGIGGVLAALAMFAIGIALSLLGILHGVPMVLMSLAIPTAAACAFVGFGINWRREGLSPLGSRLWLGGAAGAYALLATGIAGNFLGLSDGLTMGIAMLGWPMLVFGLGAGGSLVLGSWSKERFSGLIGALTSCAAGVCYTAMAVLYAEAGLSDVHESVTGDRFALAGLSFMVLWPIVMMFGVGWSSPRAGKGLPGGQQTRGVLLSLAVVVELGVCLAAGNLTGDEAYDLLSDWDVRMPIGRIVIGCASVLGLLGLMNLYWSLTLRTAGKVVRLGAIAIHTVGAGIAVVWATPLMDMLDFATSEIIGSVGIATIPLSLVLFAILMTVAKSETRTPIETMVPAAISVRAFCPRCQAKTKITPTGSKCSGCGLEMAVRWRDTRCPKCSYSLQSLEAEHCPECGHPATYREHAVGPIAWEFAPELQHTPGTGSDAPADDVQAESGPDPEVVRTGNA